jgi:hypothetical protein
MRITSAFFALNVLLKRSISGWLCGLLAAYGYRHRGLTKFILGATRLNGFITGWLHGIRDMKIIVHLLVDEYGRTVGGEVHRAIEVLRVADILTEGSIEDGRNAVGVIMLRYDSDLPQAMLALRNAGIRASRY